MLFHTWQGFASLAAWTSRSRSVSTQLEFLKGNVPGYVCNHGSPRERDAASQGHTSGIPTRAMLHSWKLKPAAPHVLLSFLVMTSPAPDVSPSIGLITHMIQSLISLKGVPVAFRRSVSFPRGTMVTYVTWDVIDVHGFANLHRHPNTANPTCPFLAAISNMAVHSFFRLVGHGNPAPSP